MKQPKHIIDKFVAAKNQLALDKAAIEQVVKKQEELCEKVIEDIEISIDKLYRLRLEEYRDDRIHCFQAAQETLVLVSKFIIEDFPGHLFVHPILAKVVLTKTGKISYKKGKIATKPIHVNWFLNWKLIDENNKVVLSYTTEEFIIPDTYDAEQLKSIRERVLSLQKF